MKLPLCLAPLALASCAAVQAVPPPPHGLENRVAIYLGQRNLDEDDYEPVEEQFTIGLEYSREGAGDAVGFEVGFMGSGADEEVAGFDVEGRTGELYGGLHKTFGDTNFRPYVGAGLAYINSEVEVSGTDDDDGSLAGYVHGGLEYAVSEAFRVGLDLRVLFASDLEIAGVETDADYGQLALFLAFGF